MARPRKTGLDYFNVDVVFDDNLECLISLYGSQALLVMIRFWQMAYRAENGEVSYTGVFRRIIMKNKFNVKNANEEKKLEQIFASAIELGLIDGEAYEQGILTSRGVKKRIGLISQVREKDRERQTSRVLPEFSNGKQTEKNSYPELSALKKRKEKEKKRKEKREGERETTNDLESVESFTQKNQPLSLSFSLPSGDNIFSETDVLKLREQLGNDQAGFWIEEVKLAYERNPNDFAKKYNSVFAVAVSWCRKCLSEGKVWDAPSKTYKIPIKKQTESKSAESLAAGALAILEKQEQRKNKELQ